MAKQDKLKYMSLDCEAVKSSTRMGAASPAAYKAYMEILISMWLDKGSLPNNDNYLMTASRLRPAQWKKAKKELMDGEEPFLQVRDGRVYNGRLTENWEDTLTRQARKSEAGKAGNKARWGDRKRIANGSQTESETDRKRIATVIESNPLNPPWGEEFDSWWSKYPRKASKGQALKAFDAVIVKGQVAESQKGLILKLKGYPARLEALKAGTEKRRPVFEKREPEHRPHPATFIRSLDWLTTEEAPEKRERMAWE